MHSDGADRSGKRPLRSNLGAIFETHRPPSGTKLRQIGATTGAPRRSDASEMAILLQPLTGARISARQENQAISDAEPIRVSL